VKGVSSVDSFLKIVAAGPAFFISAWLLMIFGGIVASDTGILPSTPGSCRSVT
jgi:hypothetical protein